MHANKWLSSLALAALIISLSTATACIPTSPEYTITFIISQGITGTPASGTFSYKEFESVPYKYEVTSTEFTWPEIFINGTRASAEGNLKVYNNFIVEVRNIDIRNDLGNPNDVWEITLFNKFGGEETVFELRFAGNNSLGGVFSDNRGYHGTWAITESKNLAVVFNNWDDALFSGDIERMSGPWTMTSYPDAYSWTATRKK